MYRFQTTTPCFQHPHPYTQTYQSKFPATILYADGELIFRSPEMQLIFGALSNVNFTMLLYENKIDVDIIRI